MSNQNWDYDVIIIGGGGAGIAAAIEALNAGATVLLCEAAQRVGGSAANSGGVIMAAGSDIQESRGIQDSVDDLYNYYMTVNHNEVEPALARRLCEGGVPTLDWLRSYGVSFNPDALYVTGIENPKAPRGHPATGMGAAIMEALSQAALSQKGLEVAVRTRVTELLVEDGRVRGIRSPGAVVRAAAVVITTGGFGNNFELLQRYYPAAARHGKEWHIYVGIKENQGDGLTMGMAAGAAIVGDGSGQCLYTASFSKEVEPYLPGWLVFVNKEGFRFIDETPAYVLTDNVLNAQPDAICFALMDHAAFTREPKDPKYRSKGFLEFPTPNWTPEMLARHLANGKVHKGITLQELGRSAGIAPEGLAATIETYNGDCAAGRDAHYRKAASFLLPLDKPPFYAVELRPTCVGTTHTGLRIDVETRVIGRNGRPIAGLYAAGECTGGVMKYYAGGGNSLLNNFVFGRVAGRNAAALARAAAEQARALSSDQQPRTGLPRQSQS